MPAPPDVAAGHGRTGHIYKVRGSAWGAAVGRCPEFIGSPFQEARGVRQGQVQWRRVGGAAQISGFLPVAVDEGLVG
jgi:hypothetical protein